MEHNGYSCRNYKEFLLCLTKRGFSASDSKNIVRACQMQGICFFNGVHLIQMEDTLSDVPEHRSFRTSAAFRPDLKISSKVFLDAQSKEMCSKRAIDCANNYLKVFPMCNHAADACSCTQATNRKFKGGISKCTLRPPSTM